MNSKLTLNAVAAALFFAADAGAQAKSDVKADPGSSCATAAVAEGADSDAPGECGFSKIAD